MTLKQQIDADLKTAMLAGDKVLATTLRGIKSAILYAEVAAGSRDTGLDDPSIIALLQKEAKKRQESAELYQQGGNSDQAEAERAEKTVIEKYLPVQMSDDELRAIVQEVIADLNAEGVQAMGQVIGGVKQRVGAQADGGRIAQVAKELLG